MRDRNRLGIRPRVRLGASLALAVLLALAGCTRSDGPVPIAIGSECFVCGMPIEDLHYAAEERAGGRTRFYDSIECLLQARPAAERAWIPDYDTKRLHAADSLWVVRGDLPSPMGGGFVAFLERSAADEIARSRRGTVKRWTAFRPTMEEAPR